MPGVTNSSTATQRIQFNAQGAWAQQTAIRCPAIILVPRDMPLELFLNATQLDHQLSSHIMGESITPQPKKGIGIPSSTPSTPANSSLYGIIRRHCRERLIVRPLLWINLHLELLQITFDEPTLAPKTNRLDYYSKRRSQFVGKRVMRSYRRDLICSNTEKSVFEPCSAGLILHLRPTRSLPSPCLFPQSLPHSQLTIKYSIVKPLSSDWICSPDKQHAKASNYAKQVLSGQM